MNATTPRPNLQMRTVSSEEHLFYDALIADLKHARSRLGLSQSDLEYRLGVSEGLVAKWESKARLPGAFFLMCWCMALNVRLTIR